MSMEKNGANDLIELRRSGIAGYLCHSGGVLKRGLVRFFSITMTPFQG
jgi:hypothetical protein